MDSERDEMVVAVELSSDEIEAADEALSTSQYKSSPSRSSSHEYDEEDDTTEDDDEQPDDEEGEAAVL